jgi:formylglycine-generating enzyme required for sulfatase activity
MGKNPSKFKGKQNPVEMVSWNDAVEFCRKLSDLPAEKSAGHVYRLPTEAEWEYACRAGTKTKYSFGDSEAELGEFGWYGKNSSGATVVGGKKPNSWGLYDMHGNVNEWCQDWYGSYPSGAVTDPTGPSSGSRRVTRGGSWLDSADSCRSARSGFDAASPDDQYISLGFRVVRSSIK